ncbi:MAG: hypothetical protein A2148_05170 [Chloroflexi bacterium RBG_16_68_14]|nr:MAG: hypothetical protein A2148_05170 [Chloroflexi bacterium RBG_16_68_14]
MSVDTYLKRKNLQPYSLLTHEDVKILVAPSLLRWAKSVHLDVKQFLFWKSFEVAAEHRHGLTCQH